MQPKIFIKKADNYQTSSIPFQTWDAFHNDLENPNQAIESDQTNSINIKWVWCLLGV